MSLIDQDAHDINIPKANYQCRIKTLSSEFQNLLKNLAYIGDYVKIDVSKSKNKIDFKSTGIDSDACIRMIKNDYTKLKFAKDFTLSFSIDYLTKYAKSSTFSSKVSIFLKEGSPILLEYKIDNLSGVIKFYIAPKSIEYLKKLSFDGLNKRYDNPDKKLTDRLNYELHIIEETNYADYFLVCWDIFSFVNKRGILSAVRGSAASSLVLFCLEVTQIDPVERDLFFERFLNIERREMPDIDMDFQDDRREEVINYVVNKYGREHVAQIITFNTLAARAVVRDVGRVMGHSYGFCDLLVTEMVL